MAITQNPLTSDVDNDGGATSTTASIAPGANRLVILAVGNRDTTGAMTCSAAGNDLTYVEILTIRTGNERLTLFRAMGAAPAAGAITITFANAPIRTMWSVTEFAGVNTGGTNGSAAVVQSVTNSSASANTLTVTLAAFAQAANGAYGLFSIDGGDIDITPGTGFAQIHDVGAGSTLSMMSEWRADNDTSVDASFAATSSLIGAAFEIGGLGGGGGSGVAPGLRGLSIFRSRGRR